MPKQEDPQRAHILKELKKIKELAREVRIEGSDHAEGSEASREQSVQMQNHSLAATSTATTKATTKMTRQERDHIVAKLKELKACALAAIAESNAAIEQQAPEVLEIQDSNNTSFSVVGQATREDILSLIDKHVEPSQRESLIAIKDGDGNTALHLAAHSGDEEIVKRLCRIVKECNAKDFIFIKNNEKKTARDVAQDAGHEDIARYLELHMSMYRSMEEPKI